MKNEDNYIKMDGEKDSFEGGAIRYTKKGKGRYDLIPSQQIHDILDYAKLNWDNIIEKDDKFCSIYNVLMSAYPEADDLTYDNYIEIIINIVRYCYIVTSNNQNFYAFMMGFVKMLKDLAIHYEMGAEKYGVDNWKNGIPETKGERGGSFRDSGLRHLQQLLDGQTDEPHQISAIWNFIGAMYVKLNKRCESCDGHNKRCEKVCHELKGLHNDEMSKEGQIISIGSGYLHYSKDRLSLNIGDDIIDFFGEKWMIEDSASKIIEAELSLPDKLKRSKSKGTLHLIGRGQHGDKYNVFIGCYESRFVIYVFNGKFSDPRHWYGEVELTDAKNVLMNILLTVNTLADKAKEKEILSKLPIDVKDFITSLICTDATGSEIWTIKTSEEFLVLKKYDEELSFLIETMEIIQDAVDRGSITMTGKDVHSGKLYQIILSFNPVIDDSLFTFKLTIKIGKTSTLSHACVTCWEDKFISNATTVDASDMDKLLNPLEKYMRKVNPV